MVQFFSLVKGYIWERKVHHEIHNSVILKLRNIWYAILKLKKKVQLKIERPQTWGDDGILEITILYIILYNTP